MHSFQNSLPINHKEISKIIDFSNINKLLETLNVDYLINFVINGYSFFSGKSSMEVWGLPQGYVLIVLLYSHNIHKSTTFKKKFFNGLMS